MKQKIKSYNLGQLKGAWGAGMASSSKNDGLIGMFFHSLNEKGEIENQGEIIKKYYNGGEWKNEEYFVRYASFLDGVFCFDEKIISLEKKEKFLFYRTAREMRYGYYAKHKYKAEDIRAEEVMNGHISIKEFLVLKKEAQS